MLMALLISIKTLMNIMVLLIKILIINGKECLELNQKTIDLNITIKINCLKIWMFNNLITQNLLHLQKNKWTTLKNVKRKFYYVNYNPRRFYERFFCACTITSYS